MCLVYVLYCGVNNIVGGLMCFAYCMCCCVGYACAIVLCVVVRVVNPLLVFVYMCVCLLHCLHACTVLLCV